MEPASVLTTRRTVIQEMNINLNFEYFEFNHANYRAHAHRSNTSISVTTTKKKLSNFLINSPSKKTAKSQRQKLKRERASLSTPALI